MQGIGLGKRARSSYHAGSCSTQPRGSLGPGVGQWIIVYDEPPREPMDQRCHEHVDSTCLEQLFKKGKQDGLYISSVAWCYGLWTLIMDAGTDFTDQVSSKSLRPNALVCLFPKCHSPVQLTPVIAIVS